VGKSYLTGPMELLPFVSQRFMACRRKSAGSVDQVRVFDRPVPLSTVLNRHRSARRKPPLSVKPAGHFHFAELRI
jgi:hypothetical protein